VTLKAVLFDLDNTLLLEDVVTTRAFREAAAVARERHGLDALALADAAESEASRRWEAAPTFAHADAIGISPGEALWGDFTGVGAELRALRDFAPRFRQEVWAAALARFGVSDAGLAGDLASAFVRARRAGQLADPDAASVLRALAGTFRLALVTNGASDVQREKLRGSGFAEHFGAVVVSGELGHGKPDPRPLLRALDALGTAPHAAAMVGDSVARDVGAARAAGVYAVWLDRGVVDADAPEPDARITSLRELPALLGAPAPRRASPRGSGAPRPG
jgi:putative hydrolase of the HAD superfamily